MGIEIKEIDSPYTKQLEVALRGLDSKVGKVGWFENANYDADKERGRHAIPVATVAAIQEFGQPSKNIPSRSFMRTTISEKQNEWGKLAETGAKDVLESRRSATDVFELIVQLAAGQIRKKIASIFQPALAQSTILARIRHRSRTKGIKNRPLELKEIGLLTKPLIDTGHMRDTLNYSVEDK